MIGVVGFDGGSRPAVALALPPDELPSDEGEEEGGGGPGDEIGACCYTDGTCDEITEFECTAAGGTFQGVGTTCSETECTGACCIGSTCSEGMTEDDCTNAGGTFQGIGTDCDPNPCESTGACCVGSDCTIETEDDCIGIGGTYQGDNTDCDPNPCISNCPCEDFFLHDGTYWRTKTVHFVGSDVLHTGLRDCVGNSDVITEVTVDPITCTSTKTCFGTGTRHEEGGADTDYTWELSGVTGYCGFFIEAGFTTDCCEPIRCDPTFGCPACAFTCDCPGGPMDGFADDCSGSFTDFANTASWTVTVTYSDPIICM